MAPEGSGTTAAKELTWGLVVCLLMAGLGVYEIVTGHASYLTHRIGLARTFSEVVLGHVVVQEGLIGRVDGVFMLLVAVVAAFYQLFPWRAKKSEVPSEYE